MINETTKTMVTAFQQCKWDHASMAIPDLFQEIKEKYCEGQEMPAFIAFAAASESMKTILLQDMLLLRETCLLITAAIYTNEPCELLDKLQNKMESLKCLKTS